MDAGKVEFTREIPKGDPREVWSDALKWKSLFETIAQAKRDGAGVLVVPSAETLGDTWREFVINLTAIAKAGLVLEIQAETQSITYNEIDFSAGAGASTVSLSEIEKGEPEKQQLVSRKLFGPVIPGLTRPEKQGPFTFKTGNYPAVILESSGPDDLYCQAELLVKRDQEEYRPSSRGRAIEGFYQITSGTMEWFLHQHSERASQGLLENYRRRIMDKGWGAFHLSSHRSGKTPDEELISMQEAKKLSYRMNLINNDVSKKDMKILKELRKKLRD